MSGSVYPSGTGSCGSTTISLIWVTHAVPETVGITVLFPPTIGPSASDPVNTAPKIPSLTNVSPMSSLPFACIAVMIAEVPVPHGDLSMLPFQVDGSFQSSGFVLITTAFCMCAPYFSTPSAEGGPQSATISHLYFLKKEIESSQKKSTQRTSVWKAQSRGGGKGEFKKKRKMKDGEVERFFPTGCDSFFFAPLSYVDIPRVINNWVFHWMLLPGCNFNHLAQS